MVSDLWALISDQIAKKGRETTQSWKLYIQENTCLWPPSSFGFRRKTCPLLILKLLILFDWLPALIVLVKILSVRTPSHRPQGSTSDHP